MYPGYSLCLLQTRSSKLFMRKEWITSHMSCRCTGGPLRIHVNACQLSPLTASHSCSTSSLSSCFTFTLRLGGMRRLRSSLVLFFLPRVLSCQTRLIRVSGMRHYQGRKGGRQQCMYLERTRMIDVSISCLVVVLDGFPQRLPSV
jgi:hypothetical protein